jgi:hypothetical protein
MGGKPSAPSPPNPLQTAAAQTASDVNTAVANATLNNVNTYTPFGSTTFNKTGQREIIEVALPGGRTQHIEVPRYESNQRLSPDQMRLLNLQERAQQNVGELAVQQSARMQDYLRGGVNERQLPDQVTNAAQAQQLQTATSPEDFVAEKHRTEEALMHRLNPQFDRDQDSLLTRLANQGVTAGSEAYNREIDSFGRQKNDARMQAILGAGQEQNRLYGLEQTRVGQANQAIQGNFANQTQSQQNQQTLRQQALQEDLALRNQPLSEINQLLRGSQPTVPQFQSWNTAPVANTPVGDYFYRSAALEQQNYLAQQQQQNAMMGGLFGLGSAGIGLFSDRKLKKNIKRVGKLDNGLDVYAYTMGGIPQIGLIAQEVEKVKPEAVGEIGGFKTVRYDLAVEA